MEIPRTTKDWVRDVKNALSEALSVQSGSVGKEGEVAISDLYKMAAPIALIFRGKNDDSLQEELINRTWADVLHVREQVPSFKDKPRRCFVHAYLDSMIHLKLLTVDRAEKIIDILERQGKIESHL